METAEQRLRKERLHRTYSSFHGTRTFEHKLSNTSATKVDTVSSCSCCPHIRSTHPLFGGIAVTLLYKQSLEGKSSAFSSRLSCSRCFLRSEVSLELGNVMVLLMGDFFLKPTFSQPRQFSDAKKARGRRNVCLFDLYDEFSYFQVSNGIYCICVRKMIVGKISPPPPPPPPPPQSDHN